MIPQNKLLKIEQELRDSLLKLKPVHSFAAKALIKDRVIQVYEIGVAYVARKFNIPLNLDRQDYYNIDKITNDSFRNWRYGHRLDAALIRVTSVALAQSIKTKSAGINRRVRALTAASFDPNFLFNLMPPSIMFSEDQELTALEDATLEEMPFIPITEEDFANTRLVWRTMQDERVCDICEPLEGQEWELDDPDALTPVDDSHPLCRCRLLLETK
jgi:hypothetical protein